MKTLNILIILLICNCYDILAQTRCDSIGEEIFVVIIDESPKSNFSIDQLEEILNNSIDINNYSRPDGNVIYVSFIINCKGEDFDYKVLRSIDKELEKQLLPVLQSNMTWTPAKFRNKEVDCGKTIEIRIEGDRFNILDENEYQKIKRKRKK